MERLWYQDQFTVLYFDLRYRDEVRVRTTRNLSSITYKVQEIPLDRHGRAQFLLLIDSSHNLPPLEVKPCRQIKNQLFLRMK
jgi:hypothetical protein